MQVYVVLAALLDADRAWELDREALTQSRVRQSALIP